MRTFCVFRFSGCTEPTTSMTRPANSKEPSERSGGFSLPRQALQHVSRSPLSLPLLKGLEGGYEDGEGLVSVPPFAHVEPVV